jgi:hypothetical protein
MAHCGGASTFSICCGQICTSAEFWVPNSILHQGTTNQVISVNRHLSDFDHCRFLQSSHSLGNSLPMQWHASLGS